MEKIEVRPWSVNKTMRAVNLWRDGVPPPEIAEKIGADEKEILAHLPEMEKLGLRKL